MDPIEPPVAGLRKGQYRAAIEFLRGETDLKLHGKEYIPTSSYSGKSYRKFKNMGFDKLYANLGYGISDNWEAFLRLVGVDYNWYLGDRNFSIGFGTKATLYEAGDLKLGSLFQLSWNWSDETEKWAYWEVAWESKSLNYEHWKTDIMEMQIAVGPTYRLT